MYVKKAKFQCYHIIHLYSVPSQSHLPSPINPYDFTSPNESLNVCEYCVSVDLTSLARIWYKV